MEQAPENGEGRPPEPLEESVLRASARRYDNILDKTLRSAVVPYGYTVTIWAAGAYLINKRGFPDLWEAFVFVAGAILAFGCLSAVSQRRRRPRRRTEAPALPRGAAHPLFGAGLHIAAVGLALGCAALVNTYLGQAAWALAPFVVTSIYLLTASAELAVAVELREREVGLESARGLVRWPRRAIRRAVRR